MAIGRVLRIERASNRDGDGLRTVIFLKGCPLRCKWCSTPESQKSHFETDIVRSKCVGCGDCVSSCQNKALSLEAGRTPVCDGNKCKGCGACADACPRKAIRVYGYDVRPEELVREIMKDLVFYQDDGGFTFSGGEPLAQPGFVLDVFKSCAGLGVRGTLETCLAVPWENVEPILPYLDSIFADVKHMSPETHKELTGSSNALVLDNIKRIDSACDAGLRIRFPLIPGVNDSDENIDMLAAFCKTLKHLNYIEILPYHRLGGEKYRQLGLAEPLPGVMPPRHEEVMPLARKLSSMCKVGVRAEGKLISATTN